MRRTLASALATIVLLLAWPASASLVEDQLPAGLHYQEDAGVPGDAPATCEGVDPARTVDLDSARTAGMLLEHDDEADAYVFELNASSVGQRVAVDLLAGLLVDTYDIAFDVRAPGCDESVFDPNATYYDNAPEDPYTVPLGSKEVAAGLTGHACEATEWKFLANQMGGIPAPATIYVEWTDGEHEYVAVDKSTPATVAMYRTSSHLDVTIARAVIVLPAWYNGQFNLVHGPCGVPVGEPEPEPLQTGRYGEFTVQEAGTHVVLVTIARGTVDKTTDTVLGTVAEPVQQVPATCHDVCSLALAFGSYDIGAAALAA